MADVTITISFDALSYQTWLRTSYAAVAFTDDEGNPLINANEFGKDQEDAFNNFIEEAAMEVLKVFLSRQGDVTGVPFEISATEVSYRFNEETPVLPQAAAIKSALGEDVKNAIFSYVTYLWYKLKLNEKQISLMEGRYEKVLSNIDRHLYKLHD